MKKFLFVILSLFICTAAENSITEVFIPDWYTGDKDLYAKFVSACGIANIHCKDDFVNEEDNKLNCYKIKDADEFNYVALHVGLCIRSLQEPIEKIPATRIEDIQTSPIGTASIRG